MAKKSESQSSFLSVFSSRTHQKSQKIAGLVLIGFALLSIWYSLVVPPFETPDELYHYAFARHLAMGNALPVQSIDDLGPWEHEGAQAPLYYLLLSRLIAPIDQSDFDEQIVINPRANLGNPHYPGNKNFFLYSSESPPRTGTMLAVLIGRWFSLGLTLTALWFAYQTARLAFRRPGEATTALCFAAAIPQLAFISASVSNDALIILASTATVYWLCVLLSRDIQRPLRTWNWVVLGLLLAMAALSKLQGLGLYALAGLVVLFLAWQRREPVLILRAGLIIGCLGLALAGWWYLRNYLLYGELLATRILLEVEGLRTTPHTIADFWGELRGLRYSFWGLFGWFSILFPVWIYWILDAITLIAVGGLVDLARRNWRATELRVWLQSPVNRVRACLTLWFALLCVAILYWLTFAISSQGRLLLPGVSAVAVLMIIGLSHVAHSLQTLFMSWSGSTVRAPDRPANVAALLSLGLLCCSLYAVLHLFPTYYTRSQPITSLPADAIPINRVYGGTLELVALEKPRYAIEARNYIEVTLYLRKLKKTNQDYELFIQLLDEEIKEIANVTTHPGWGRNPTSFWQVGEIYADTYRLFVHPPNSIVNRPDDDNSQANVTVNARLFVGFRTTDNELLEVVGYAWDIDSMTVGRVEVMVE